MKKHLLPLLLTVGLATGAHATTYSGNGGTGFNGAVGTGSLSVTNDSAGDFVFAFTLGTQQTNLSGNDIVVYIDNNQGGGIGTSTAGLTDTGDGGREAASGYDGTDRSTLSFGNFLNPQFALDISVNNANVYGLVNNGSFSFNGGQPLGGTSQDGVTFTSTTANGSTVLTETVPAGALNLTPNAAASLRLLAIQVSETGYSSNEATVGITGGPQGYGNTQTIAGVNTFTVATAGVPEPSTWAWLLLGVGALAISQRRRLCVG